MPFVTARRAAPVDEARVAAAELGYPVAVKALGLLHKSDAGGVALGLADDAAVLPQRPTWSARLAARGLLGRDAWSTGGRRRS